MVNSVDPDHSAAFKQQIDKDLHCLHKDFHSNIYGHYNPEHCKTFL